MIAALLLTALAQPSAGVMVDRVIAIVDKEVITYSELTREARVALVLREDAKIAAGELSAEVLRSFLEFLVNQVVIATQARRVAGIEVRNDEVDREVERFAGRFSSVDAYRAFMRRFDISDNALKDILRRDLRNARYIAQRLRAWRAVAEDGQSDADAQYRAALERWVTELRAGIELRLLGASGDLELQ